MGQYLRRPWRRQASYVMLLLLGPAVVPTTRISASGELTRHDVCRYGSWSRATWLERVGSLLAATLFPTVAVSSEKPRRRSSASTAAPAGYVVGVAGFAAIEFLKDSAWPTKWPPQLRAIGFNGKQFSRPGDGFWYVHPRAAIDDLGTVHVVWAEPDARLPAKPTTLNGVLPELRSVWYATLHDGKWSRAERIYQGQRLEWDDNSTSRLIVDGQRRLHVAFGSLESRGYMLVYLSVVSAPGRRWRSTKVPSRMGMGYLDLAVGSNGDAAIAIITGIALPRPWVDVLSVTRSADGGSTWTPLTEVTTPAEEPAIEPHLFFDRSSALRLVWVQQPTGTFVGGKLWHTVLSGMDRHSTSALALPSAMMTSHSQAAIDSCGTLHAFTQAYPNGPSELSYARLGAGGWSAWTWPFDVPGGHVSIAASSTLIHVVWQGGARLPSADGVQRSGLAHATLPVLGQ